MPPAPAPAHARRAPLRDATAGTPAVWACVGLTGLVLLLVAWLGHEHVGWAAGWDAAALDWGASQPLPVTGAALLLQTLGRAVVVLFMALLLGVLLAKRGRPWEGASLVAVVVASNTLAGLLKQLFGRVRPEAAWAYTADFGFPSGHAALGAAVACLVVWLGLPTAPTRVGRVALLGAAAVWALAMAASRVVLNVHYFTDVLGGLGLGLAVSGFGLAASEALRRRHGLPQAGHPLRQNG